MDQTVVQDLVSMRKHISLCDCVVILAYVRLQ